MLDYTRGKFVALKLNTNAWFLDEKKCHAILKAELNSLVFSVDAASEPTYSQFRVGGQLDRIHKNIKLFHDIRFKHYPKSRIITRISGVKFPGVDPLDEMEKFWGNLVDQVAFVNYNPWESIYDRPVNDIEAPCSDLWRRMFIWWDGKINPCDSDFKSRLSIGNASTQNIDELWGSEKYSELRKQHLRKFRSECSPCKRCTVV
jgi:radical SAM protein with 4Fe4S-binding SPASM domain